MLELKRDIYEELKAWKKQDSGKVLELNGARQVGKTFILDKFARENYKRYFYINMIQTSGKEFIECYHAATSWKPGEKRIEGPLQKTFELFDDTFVDDKNTIVVIDEIQESAEVYSMIRQEILIHWFWIHFPMKNFLEHLGCGMFMITLIYLDRVKQKLMKS